MKILVRSTLGTILMWILFGAISSVEATAQTAASEVQPILPKYKVMGVVYAPPGSASSVSYANSNVVGSTDTFSTTNSSTQVSTLGISGEVGVPWASASVSVSSSSSTGWSASMQNQHSVAMQTTTGNSLATMGPISSSLGVDHDNDVIYIWLNPVIVGTGSTSNGVSTFAWTGLQSDGCDPSNPIEINFYQEMNGCDPNQYPFPDIVGIPVWCLKNPYYPGQGCAQWVQNYTSRSWDTYQWGTDPTTGLPLGPSLTLRDYADILQSDPFVTLNANDVNVCHPGSGSQAGYGPEFDPNLSEILNPPLGSPGFPLGYNQIPYALFNAPNGNAYALPATCTGYDSNGSATAVGSTMTRFQPNGAVEYPVPGPNGLPSTYTGTFQYSNDKAQSTTATSSETVGTNFSASATFGFCFFACAGITASSSTSNSLTTQSQTVDLSNVTNSTSASYAITGPQLSDNYNGPATYNVYLDNIYGTFAFYSDLDTPVTQQQLGTIAISPGSASCTGIGKPCIPFGSEPVGSSSAPQMFTLTNTSAFPMTMPGPAVTFSDPAFQVATPDGCSNAYIPAAASCTLWIVFKPVTSDIPSTSTGTPQLVTADMIAAGTVNAASYQNILVVNYEILSGTAIPAVWQGDTLQPTNVQNPANPNIYSFAGTNSAPVQFTFKNNSSSQVTITQLALSDATDFSIAASNSYPNRCIANPIVPISASCTFYVQFNSAANAASAFYSTKITALGTAGTTNVTSLAIAGASGQPTPSLTISPLLLGFGGSVCDGTCPGGGGNTQPQVNSLSVTITNNAPTAAALSPLAVNSSSVVGTNGGGTFAITASTCGSSLAGAGVPAASCTLTVTATPANCDPPFDGSCQVQFGSSDLIPVNANWNATQTSYSAAVSANASWTFYGSQPHCINCNVVSFPSVPQNQTVSPGGTAQIAFSVAPTGADYPGTVTFSATGLPPGAIAVFSPASIAPGSGTQSIVLSIQLAAAAAALSKPEFQARSTSVFLGLLLIPPVVTMRRVRKLRHSLSACGLLAIMVFAGCVASGGLVGCSSRSPAVSAAPVVPQTYVITITATTDGTSQSTNMTLTVQ